MQIEQLKFCPQCAQETLSWDGKKWSCSACHFVLYHNVAAAVAVLVRCGSEILLTRRNQEPKKGKLDLAGGFTDPRESAEETCARELKEELNISIDLSNLNYLASLPNVYIYKEIPYNTLDLFYEYQVAEKFDVQLEASEISIAIWVEASEINLDEIAFDSQRKFLAAYKELHLG